MNPKKQRSFFKLYNMEYSFHFVWAGGPDTIKALEALTKEINLRTAGKSHDIRGFSTTCEIKVSPVAGQQPVQRVIASALLAIENTPGEIMPGSVIQMPH